MGAFMYPATTMVTMLLAVVGSVRCAPASINCDPSTTMCVKGANVETHEGDKMVMPIVTPPKVKIACDGAAIAPVCNEREGCVWRDDTCMTEMAAAKSELKAKKAQELVDKWRALCNAADSAKMCSKKSRCMWSASGSCALKDEVLAAMPAESVKKAADDMQNLLSEGRAARVRARRVLLASGDVTEAMDKGVNKDTKHAEDSPQEQPDMSVLAKPAVTCDPKVSMCQPANAHNLMHDATDVMSATGITEDAEPKVTIMQQARVREQPLSDAPCETAAIKPVCEQRIGCSWVDEPSEGADRCQKVPQTFSELLADIPDEPSTSLKESEVIDTVRPQYVASVAKIVPPTQDNAGDTNSNDSLDMPCASRGDAKLCAAGSMCQWLGNRCRQYAQLEHDALSAPRSALLGQDKT